MFLFSNFIEFVWMNFFSQWFEWNFFENGLKFQRRWFGSRSLENHFYHFTQQWSSFFLLFCFLSLPNGAIEPMNVRWKINNNYNFWGWKIFISSASEWIESNQWWMVYVCAHFAHWLKINYISILFFKDKNLEENGIDKLCESLVVEESAKFFFLFLMNLFSFFLDQFFPSLIY